MLEPLAARQPFLYRMLVIVAALIGYLLLVMFPLIALYTLIKLPGQLQTINQWQDGAMLAAYLLVLLVAAALSLPLLRLRFTPPQGMHLNRQNAPKLYQLVEQLRREFRYPMIDAIVLGEGFRIDMARVPRFGMPLLYRNTLMIGLDALLTLPPEQFTALLARRIGQLGGRHQRDLHWLAGLRHIWLQYQQALAQQQSPLAWPLRAVFGLYTPLYDALAFYVARQSELEADRYALDIANDDELASLFSQLIITETFLATKFWPKITQLARRQNAAEHRPYASMAGVLRRGLTREEMQSWIKAAFETVSDTDNAAPLLQQRLDNIGHHKPAPPRPLKQSAADQFMEPAVMQKIINKFDQRWLAKLK